MFSEYQLISSGSDRFVAMGGVLLNRGTPTQNHFLVTYSDAGGWK